MEKTELISTDTDGVSSGGQKRKEKQHTRKRPAAVVETSAYSKPATVDKPGFTGPEIRLDSNTARNAVILSEIIGKPLAKRGRRK